MKKKQLGQFFTANSDFILKGLEKYVKGKDLVDPFVGGGDLIKWAQKNNAKSVKGFDIDEEYVDGIVNIKHDSLLEPQKYKFVLTNPPYLNINKASKETKEKYFKHGDLEDLYQISLRSIMDSEEGIVIVPINFLSAKNSTKIRKEFFNKFQIVEMNYFKEQVFPDTTYNVIAFYYKKNPLQENFSIKTHIYPEGQETDISLSRKYDWTIGGEFLIPIKNQPNILGVHRLTEELVESGPHQIPAAYNHIDNHPYPLSVSTEFMERLETNIILLRAIDSGTQEGKIRLENIKKYNVECLVSKPSSRNMVYLMFEKNVEPEDQVKLIDLFNKEINELRENYLSLFLTNFRDNDRKRISFDFVYKMINHLYCQEINPNHPDSYTLNVQT